MNDVIKELNQKLKQSKVDNAKIEIELQEAWNKFFEDSHEVRAMVAKVENSNDYTTDKYGKPCSYTHFDLSDFEDAKPYFENYMRDTHSISIRWENGSLLLSHGDDSLIIRDDTRRDNGVWQNGKCVINESEYKNDDGEIDTARRNQLIEAHMEKTGFFPSVFRMDYYNNIFAVNTRKNS